MQNVETWDYRRTSAWIAFDCCYSADRWQTVVCSHEKYFRTAETVEAQPSTCLQKLCKLDRSSRLLKASDHPPVSSAVTMATTISIVIGVDVARGRAVGGRPDVLNEAPTYKREWWVCSSSWPTLIARSVVGGFTHLTTLSLTLVDFISQIKITTKRTPAINATRAGCR